ncbi:MAG: hypothetical protein ACRBN8_08070 [Nannocystales bacterium]
MRWSLGPWVALCLTMGCTDFVGNDTDGETAGSGETNAPSPTTGGPTSGDSNATAMTATGGQASTSTTAPTTATSTPGTDTTDSATTAGPSTETTDASNTTGGEETTDSESTASPVSCDNETMDGDETDVDCGGSCSPCEFEESCLVGTDCTTGFCTPSSACGLQQPQVWLDALDDATLFRNDECSESPPTDGQQVYCWTNKGSAGGMFLDEGGQPNYREDSDGVEFSNDSMVSDSDVFNGPLADVAIFMVQEEVDSRNSFDFNLNHPSQGGGRYSSHIPWGNSDRRVIFDIGGSGNAARIATALNVIEVGETHLFSFVNSAESAQRLIFIDGAEEASEAESRTANASAVSVGNGNDAVLYEFRVYSPSPSGAQRQVIEGQLACRWDLRDELPATHPFYDANGASEADCPPSL